MAKPTEPTSRWQAVTDALVDHMMQGSVLSVPRDRLGELSEDADQMVADGALIRRDGGYAFFHEGLLDYFVARRFLEGEQSLIEVITSGEQPLTMRPLVRRVLQAQREDSYPRYVEALRLLLGHDEVRFLIKDAALAVLATVSAPEPAEWLLIADVIENPNAKGNSRAWRVVAQPSWFDLLDSMGVVSQWIASPTETHADLAVSLLRSVDRDRPARVAELASTRLGTSESWNQRLSWLMSTTDLSAEPALVRLAVALIAGGLEDNPDGSLSGELLVMCGHRLPDVNPRGAVDLIEALLQRGTDLANSRGTTDPFDYRAGTLRINDHEQIATRTAQADPRYFADRLLPTMLGLADANQGTRHPPHRDSIWGYRHVGQQRDLEDELLAGMSGALKQLAVADPESFARLAVLLKKHSHLETALVLLYRAWGASPQKYSADAIRFLVSDDDRVAVGPVDRNYWETVQLIAAIAPDASPHDLSQLSSFLLNYHSWWERDPQGKNEWGRAQAELLIAIPEDLRSESVRERIDAARKQFSEKALEGEPEPIRVGYVRSPVDRSEATSYTDADWIDAIQRYPDSDGFSSADLVGGAHEFSQVLEDFTKRAPDRFGRLALQLPDDANVAYFDALLRGLGEAEEPPESAIAFDAMRRCHDIPGRPCGRWIARPAKPFAAEDVPRDVIELVAWYLTGPTDPDHESWETPADGGEPYYGGDPYGAGINTDRGAAAEGLASLIWPSAQRLDWTREEIRKLVHDPIIAVRTCAATTLIAAYRHDEDFAVELFRQLVDDAPDILLRAMPVERFLRMALDTHIAPIAPVISRMLASDDADVREAGGRLACFAALEHEEAANLSEEALSGDDRTRKGAAQVFAANVDSAAFRSICVEGLIRLFDDEDLGVRKEAGECFRSISDDRLPNFTDLIGAFINSPAFVDDHFHLLYAMEQSPGNLSEEAVAAGRAFVDRILRPGHAPSTSALHSSTVSTVVMRAYKNADALPALRSRALDVMDDLLAAQVYGIERELDRFESA